jgi:hypothetical protein
LDGQVRKKEASNVFAMSFQYGPIAYFQSSFQLEANKEKEMIGH